MKATSPIPQIKALYSLIVIIEVDPITVVATFLIPILRCTIGTWALAGGEDEDAAARRAVIISFISLRNSLNIFLVDSSVPGAQ